MRLIYVLFVLSFLMVGRGSFASTEEVGFSEEQVRQIKTLVGTFLTEEVGLGGYYSTGFYDKGEVVGELLCNDRRAYESHIPRIEARKTGDLVVQMAIALETREQCKQFLTYFKENLPFFDELEVLEGGTNGTVVELGSRGVTKSTLMHYLSSAPHFRALLDQSGYERGKEIDAYNTLTAIASDANGTLFPVPREGLPYSECDLFTSAARESILAYLEKGGFLIVNSGNDPIRVAGKIMRGIPDEKRYLLKNIAIGVANGHLLFIFDPSGEGIEEVVSYRNMLMPFRTHDPKEVAFLYLGDNPKPSGNDWEGFEAAGFKQSICVPDAIPSQGVAQEIEGQIVIGNDVAVDKVFRAIVEMAGEGQEVRFTPSTVDQIIQKIRE